MNPNQIREALRNGKTVRWVKGLSKNLQHDRKVVGITWYRERGTPSRWLPCLVLDDGCGASLRYRYLRYFVYIDNSKQEENHETVPILPF